MIPLLSFIVLTYLASFSYALAIPILDRLPFRVQTQLGRIFSPASRTLCDPYEQWIQDEKQIALDRLLANVAPGGANTKSAAPGTVIASPSTENPNYYYHWIRDGAITLSTTVPYLDAKSSLSSHVFDIFDAYNHLTYRLQRTTNPSGRFYDLKSLGEPKFEVSGEPFTGPWGRPQPDGPALRAITMMEFLTQYNRTYPSVWGTAAGAVWYRTFYDPQMPSAVPDSTVKADLEYVSKYWGSTGFDLWEEVNGRHFFTAMVQLRALRDGAKLAGAFGDPGAASWYSTQAAQLQDLIHTFWDEKRGHLISIQDTPRSGLDCSILLGSLHGTSLDQETNTPFPPHSPEILLSLLALLRDQRARFPINSVPTPSADEDPLRAAGIGRYPEDAYNGYESIPGAGNPWFLCTSSAAEVLYRTRHQITRHGSLTITQRGLPFWNAVVWNATAGDPDLQPGDYGCTTDAGGPACKTYEHVVQRLTQVADNFLGVVKRHSGAQGSMSEQFDRVTGYERGARDLTWSYGAFLSAVRAREIAA
ncbi:hypothetical protein P152DRAFT_262287 [Eremomyces bilateralis CBS 781.70]|uniref:glucan 1,4-alpha-glucosidase n=1 Tax=Eremomyces bilateralis CBS 781.70 TaxID=1392243 RepID=A0A6G1G8F6_9PEZI|nr:uncharacterized protein P152DRAFT_262287 [Eremomyces bilateralis CBS 781.70]KAF1814139.1 hypothetical protein P152DRAFT_262287 [Eremomyces bilateralis CBS 781.70]